MEVSKSPIEAGPINNDAAVSIGKTRALFVALCLYIGSQAFTIPVTANGPWAVWLTLSDFAFLIFGLIWLFRSRAITRLPAASSSALKNLSGVVVLGVASYLLITLLANHLNTESLWSGSGILWGAYTVVRLIQFALLFWFASSVPLSSERVSVIYRVSYAALLTVVALCVMTYVGSIQTADMSWWLPQDLETGGPWAFYTGNHLTGQGVGGVGYNHGYSALQILLLLGLVLQLRPDKSGVSRFVAIGIAGVGVFVTGSGAGLIGFLTFLLLYVAVLPAGEKLIASIIGGTTFISFLVFAREAVPDLSNTMVRAAQRLNVLEYDSDVLTGRPDIWSSVVNALLDEPIRLVVGFGVGLAGETIGTNAHSFPLQVVLELGVFGMAVFLGTLIHLSYHLRQQTQRTSVMWLMALALALTSLTQETFYPVPAFGHFLGFFLLVSAITIRMIFDFSSIECVLTDRAVVADESSSLSDTDRWRRHSH